MPSRRELLTGSAALALSATLPPFAEAKAPLAGKQVPGIYRQMVGSIEVTALLDGDRTLPPEFFSGAKPGEAKPEEQKTLAVQAYQSYPVHSPSNVFAVNTGDKLYLVDTGAGSFGKSYPGSELGHLGEALAAAGITRGDVDAILLTHLHPDHIGGLLKDDEVQFPRAEIIAPAADLDFWLSPETAARVPDNLKFLFDLARKTMKPYESRIRKIRYGSIAPGIDALAIAGHTPGHTGYMIGRANERMMIWGDLVHNATLQFAHPEWSTSFDTDPDMAREARRVGFEFAADDAMLVAGMHLPFPGIGRVERRSTGGYVYHPVPWTPKY